MPQEQKNNGDSNGVLAKTMKLVYEELKDQSEKRMEMELRINERIDSRIAAISSQITKIEISVAKLQVKASLWGGGTGGAVGVLTALIMKLTAGAGT